MNAVWQDLFDRLPHKYARTELSRFFRYCSARGIAPEAVDDVVSGAFLVALVDESLIKRPKIRHQSMCRLWNRMPCLVEGWPDVVLEVPRYRQTYGVAWATFPASLHNDVLAYLDRLAHVDLLDLDGPDQALKPLSITTRELQLRLAASSLVATGMDVTMVGSLADLVAPQRLRQILTFFLERNGNKTSSHVFGIATALRGVARYHVALSAEDLAEVERLVDKVKLSDVGMSPKSRQRLRQFEDKGAQRRLIELPIRTLEKIEKADNGKRGQAVLAARALGLLILAFAPMRIGNLAGLHIERQLRWQRPGRQGELYITIGSEEVKNRQNLNFILPPPVARRVAHFIENLRPRLLKDPTNGYLFPGRGGGPKACDSISKPLSKWVWDETGLAFHPHLMRHIAAKIMADARPGEYEAIRRLLGHKRMDSTYRFYQGEETLSAVRLYDRLILALLGEEDEEDDDDQVD